VHGEGPKRRPSRRALDDPVERLREVSDDPTAPSESIQAESSQPDSDRYGDHPGIRS